MLLIDIDLIIEEFNSLKCIRILLIYKFKENWSVHRNYANNLDIHVSNHNHVFYNVLRTQTCKKVVSLNEQFCWNIQNV